MQPWEEVSHGSWAKDLLVPTRVQSGCPLLSLRTSLERPLGLPWTQVMGLHIVSHGCVGLGVL